MADGEKRIIELEELTTLTDNDYIAVDNSASGGETKKFKPKNLQDATNQVLEDVAYLTWENNHYYNRGDIVAYEGYLYVCKVDEATYGSFERSDWKKTFVERWGRDLFFDISSQEMIFSNDDYTLPYSKGDVVYRYYPHPSNDGFEMRFYVAKADYPNGVTEYDASQWDEYYSLSEVVDALNKETNKSVDEALALGTASGDIATFTDGSTLPMKKLEVDIEPVQDLHGYENPWVGGSGKNKLQNTANTQTINGVTFTVNEDGTVKANGTATDAIMLVLNTTGFTLPSGNYKISAGVEGTSGTTYFVCSNYASGQRDYTNDGAFTSDGSTTYRPSIYIVSGVTLSNVVFKPMIRLASVSDATFAPYSNICPISGWDECNVSDVGVNLWDEETEVVSNVICSKNYIPVRPNTQYYFTPHQGRDYICYDKYYNVIKDWTWLTPNDTILTTPSNCYYIKFRMTSGYGTTYNHDISINYPSTDTSYHAYNGQTYTIDLDGTCYGGTLDVVSGVLTVDRATSSGKVTALGTVQTYENITYGRFEKPSDSKNRGDTSVHNLISNMYLVDSATYNWDDASKIGKLFVGADYNNFWIGFPHGTTLTEMQNITNDNTICYELATPITYQLTPTEVKSLLATNNIFADTGQVNDATYVRNANITINDLIRRIEALES